MDLFAPNHLILIALVILLLFGGKKIPELMRGLGKGAREFSDAKNNIRRTVEESMSDTTPPAPQSTTTPTTGTQP